MKKITSLFFVAVLYAANTLAAADTTISRVIPGKSNGLIENTDSERGESAVVNRAARRVNVANNNDTKSVAMRATTRTNNTATRSQGKTVNVISRSVNNQKSDSSRATLDEGVNTVGRNARVNSASINSEVVMRRPGVALRTSTAEVVARAKNIETDKQTESNKDEQVRGVQGRALSLTGFAKPKTVPVATAESISKAKDILEKTADLNNTCQQQYNECMDQFCAVVDANQKRCSCSANLSRYVKAQEAVEQANTELNDVAQRIRYVGLSADEIRAIMSETEAEEAMTKNKDTSENRSLLDDIADMIKDPSSKSSSTTDTSSILDLDFDFSESSDEIFGLGISLGGSSNDIAKKRGKDLYNEAAKRCKSVLTSCKEAGGTESQITGNYDLAIDKDCIAYQAGLDKLNKTLVSNVRSANLMLQKARLAVLQNKNQYDIRGCIGALEKCMLDDMVCGEGYLKCLDPTKKYIDENGEVVLGQKITDITGFMKEYDNSNIDRDFVRNSPSSCSGSSNGGCIVNYLMSKIGTGSTVKDGGLCRAVLDKCQDYTYTTNNNTSTYKPYNDVVVNYIQRAMVNIKAAQSKIISDYASTCLSDMSDCYNQQITQINSLTDVANLNNVIGVMRGACYNVALTCGYAVLANEPNKIQTATDTVANISEVFYQSLLCPTNSTYNQSAGTPDVNRKINGYVNNHCQCNPGYTVWNGSCLQKCETNQYRNASGICVSGCATDNLGYDDSSTSSDDIEYSRCNTE